MKFFTSLFYALLVLLISTPAYAQTGVGQLSGKITDADTKEPLIGANIIIVNTDWGAASDINGEDYILNIPPGTYEVRVSYVGYAPKTIQEVRIVAGITYELNVELSTDFTLPEIIVQDRKLFEEKATNTVKVIDADQISRLPVRGVTNLASLQSGVVIEEGSGGQSGNASINVRGGRGSEVLYIVDGVPQNNLYNRSSVAQVSNVAIDQISFQVGGYEAKYGQAQSGIVNVTTKSGNPSYNILADVISSSFTDNYGYNIYSGVISGPIIPGINEHTFFVSGERQWSLDDTPPAIKYEYPSIGKSYDYTPNNPSSAWRFSGKTTHRLGDFSVILSGLYNKRTARLMSFSKSTGTLMFIKNNSAFMDEFLQENTSLNARISQTISASTFWNINIGYRLFDFERYNPFFYRDLVSYGDSVKFAQLGATLLGNGRRTTSVDDFGVFRPYGYANGLYQRREDDAISLDIDLTSQVGDHLLEIGAGAQRHVVRGYGVFAYQLLAQPENLSLVEKFKRLNPFVYGYDVTGQSHVNSDFDDGSPLAPLQRPYEPIIGYAYIQDRFELEDLVLNIGVRMDYFDLQSYELVNPALPF